ncbi:MAG: ATP-grasp domain-containing protein [Woeseiaceae bacterium]
MKCAFLTMQDPGKFVMDYDLCFGAFANHGWTVEEVKWRDTGADWDQYDAVYLCTAWDYPDHFDDFVALLNKVEASSAMLINDLSLVRWNMRKTYLRDLQAAGADIVPSLWFDGIAGEVIDDWFDAHGTDTVIIKPVVGANAQDTFVLHNPVDNDTRALLRVAFQNRAYLVQPFVENIRTEGEFSLFYFGGEFSHAILKRPASGEFRSQEEYGSQIKNVQPEAVLRSAGAKIVALIEPQPVYVRVDLIRGPDGRFLLMELELIEPSLYLRTDDGAAERFAAAFDQHFRTITPPPP